MESSLQKACGEGEKAGTMYEYSQSASLAKNNLFRHNRAFVP